jgi:hypothetical protein
MEAKSVHQKNGSGVWIFISIIVLVGWYFIAQQNNSSTTNLVNQTAKDCSTSHLMQSNDPVLIPAQQLIRLTQYGGATNAPAEMKALSPQYESSVQQWIANGCD